MRTRFALKSERAGQLCQPKHLCWCLLLLLCFHGRPLSKALRTSLTLVATNRFKTVRFTAASAILFNLPAKQRRQPVVVNDTRSECLIVRLEVVCAPRAVFQRMRAGRGTWLLSQTPTFQQQQPSNFRGLLRKR